MLILADEPTGNLDEMNEGVVLEILKQLHDEGSAIIVVTHDPEVAEEAQRTVVLEHGRIARIDEKEGTSK
jgi:putative ABC transport system ATP-binding protein